MGKFGTSESRVFTSLGELKILEDTDEVCTTCDGSAAGESTFGIIRETPTSATLMCPNCGDQKNIPASDVKRKRKPAELAALARRHAELAASAAASQAEEAAKKKAVQKKAAQKKPAKPSRPAKKTKAKAK